MRLPSYIMTFIPYKYWKFLLSKIYLPLFFNIKVIYRNKAYIVFSDGSFIHDFSFMVECDKNGKNWMEESKKLYPKEYLK